jgi:hypothetical protein
MKISLPLDDKQRSHVRPASKAVFKSRYALEAMVVMAQEDTFFQGQIAEQAGCEPSYAGELMKRFAAAGLIEALPKEPGQVRKYYRSLPSPLWESSQEFLAHLLSDGPPDVARLTDRR